MSRKIFHQKKNVSIRVKSVFSTVGIDIDLATIAQYAAALALQTVSLTTLDTMTISNSDEKGEMNEYTYDLYDDINPIRIAFCTKFKKDINDDEWYNIIGKYITYGLGLMEESLNSSKDNPYEFIRYLSDMLGMNNASEGSTNSIDIRLGKDVRSSLNYVWTLNKEGDDQNSAHMSIVGSTGVGKTQLLLSMMYDALKNNPGLSCIVFDYKGDITETYGDLFKDMEFNSLVLGKTPLPINPLIVPTSCPPESFAQGFAETTKVYRSKMGDVQVNKIGDAFLDAFNKKTVGKHITFKDLYESFTDLFSDKIAGDVYLLKHLSEYNLFDLSSTDSELHPLSWTLLS